MKRRFAVEFCLGRMPGGYVWQRLDDAERRDLLHVSRFVLDVRAVNPAEARVIARSDALALAEALVRWAREPKRLFETARAEEPCREWSLPYDEGEPDEEISRDLDYEPIK